MKHFFIKYIVSINAFFSYFLLNQVLLIAAILGDVEKARVALQKGANVNTQDVVNYKYEPIYFKFPLENYKIDIKL